MILTVDQIPDEVVEAARAAYREGFELLDSHEKIMRASLAAALSAWPRAHEKPYWELRTHERYSELILPLPDRPKR